MNQPDEPFTEDEIAAVAKQMWEEEGRPDGKSAEHWARAKDHLLGRGVGGEYAKPPDDEAGIHG